MTTAETIELPPVVWPALLQYQGEPDYTVVESWQQWVEDTDLSGYQQEGPSQSLTVRQRFGDGAYLVPDQRR